MDIAHNAIHVYCCRYDSIDEPRLLDCYRGLLDQAEQRRWQGIRSEEGRRCFLVSRAMLRVLLGEAIGCSPTALTITTNAWGKPRIDQPATRWQFNLSHSHGLIALILAYDLAVGIDVECLHRNLNIPRLVRHFFHPREIQQLEVLSAAEQREHFFRLWTLKEAYVKAIGRGLSLALDSFGFTFQYPGARLALHLPLPTPSSIKYCLMQPEPGFTLAGIALSKNEEARRLKLYDCLPFRYCLPRPLQPLVQDIIVSSVPDSPDGRDAALITSIGCALHKRIPP